MLKSYIPFILINRQNKLRSFMARKKKSYLTVGWREIVSIPSLGIKEIKAKIDTGARTSSLHVTDLKIIKRGNTKFAEFNVHPKQKSALPKFKNRVRIESFRNVKSSNGITSRRPVIVTTVIMGTLKKEIEITLVNRDLMGFRMLLGRTTLKGDFLINPAKSYLLQKDEQ